MLRLYRILTELRDINKNQTGLPLFYYIIAIALPTIVVSLTLGIKQDIYTNFSLFTSLTNSANSFSNFYLSSVYCWLCVTNYYEIFYVLVLPLALLLLVILMIIVLSFISQF